MRHHLIPPAISIAAVSALALTAPSVGYAAPAAHDRAAKTVTVTKSDPVGDVVVKSGKLSDLAGDAKGLGAFKPGHGTVVPATDADRAADLTKVTYRVRRGGPQPALLITYAVASPFSYSHATNQTATTYSQTVSEDVVATRLGNGLTVGADDDHPHDYGLDGKRGKKISCKGLRTTMKLGTRVATQAVPLSCLTEHGLRTARLRSAAVHVDMTLTASPASDPMRKALQTSTTIIDGDVTEAVDYAKPTRRLQLTPLGR